MTTTNSLIVGGANTSGDIFGSNPFFFAIGGGNSTSTTEAPWQRKLQAGTVSGLGLFANTNGAGVPKFVFRKNGADGNNTCTLTASAWIQDTTHSDSITAGDLCNLGLHTTGGPDTFLSSNCLTFNAASPLSTMCWAAGGGLAVTSTSNNFAVIAAGAENATSTTEANFKTLARAAGTYNNLECYISANTIASVGSNINFRKNGANGNQTLSIGTLATGQFQDTTHTDSVVTGDSINYLIDAGAATGTLTVNLIDVSNSGAISAQDLVNGLGAGYSVAATSEFWSLAGAAAQGTTENVTQIKPNYATTLTKLRLNVLTNTASATTSWKSRKNAGNGNLLLTLTNGVTGVFEDTTHSDSIVGTDAINTEFVANGGTGGCTLAYIAVTADDGSVTAAVNVNLIAASATASAAGVTPDPGATPSGVATTGAAAVMAPSLSVPLPAASTTAAAAAVVPSAPQSLGAVSATSQAEPLTPGVSVPLVVATTSGAAAGVSAGSGQPIGGVSTSAAAQAVAPQVSVNLVGVVASGVAAGMAAGPQIGLVAVSSTAGFAAVTPSVGVPLAPAIAQPDVAPFFFGQLAPFPIYRLMSDTGVALAAAIDDTPIAVIAQLEPSGPAPRSVEILLVGVGATCFAATITPSRDLSVRLAGVSASAAAMPVVAA